MVIIIFFLIRKPSHSECLFVIVLKKINMFFQIYHSLYICIEISVCLFTERTVSEVTINRDEVEEANQTLHGNKLEFY